MKKRKFFPFLFLLSALLCSTYGQAQKQVLQGTIRDKQSSNPLRTASIRNIFTGNTVVSRSAGQFSMPASKGNILSFSATGYYTDTLTVTDSVLQLETLTIALRPLAATLPDVTVTAGLNPYQLDSLERRRQFLALVGESKIPALGKANELGFGMAINLDHFSKREKKKRTARSLFDITEQEAYINYRWNDSLVIKYTGFKDDQLTEFMQTYRPTWDWLRENQKEEDLVYYINRSLKKFSK